MEQNRRCDICNIEISKTNWSKHIKTKIHLAKIRDSTQREVISNEEVLLKHYGICNVDIPENEWNNHLKSPSHNRNTKLIKNLLKEKVGLFNIRRQRKRNFQGIDFETDDYIIKKVRRSSREMFLNIKNNSKE
jgi:hypothetical protein